MIRAVILIQLDGISECALWQYHDELAAVLRLMSTGMRFRRFFTAAVSGTTTAADVLRGECAGKGGEPFEWSRRDEAGRPFLPAEFARRGYAVRCFDSSPLLPRRESGDEVVQVMNIPDQLELCKNAARCLAEAEKTETPLFLFIRLRFPGLKNRGEQDIATALRGAYSELNMTVETLFSETLANRRDDGIVAVAYGVDAGRGGGCGNLASAPTWAPMTVMGPEIRAGGDNDALVSAVDIGPTLLETVLAGEHVSDGAGINIFKGKRDFAFSRGNAGTWRAVTDGDYLLHASGNDLGLYCRQTDPFGSLNLLKLFRRDAGGGSLVFDPPAGAVAKHFSAVFGDSQIGSIAAAFDRLRLELEKFA